MTHSVEQFSERLNDILHDTLGGTLFFRHEIIEVPDLLTALLVTYDDVRDDSREIHSLSWEAFVERMSIVKPDWKFFDRANMEKLAAMPEKVIGGWEGRTIYFIKGGHHTEQWTPDKASLDATALLTGSWNLWGASIKDDIDRLREVIPVGRESFRDFERIVRIVFNFLFRGELGEGRAQSRTASESEGVEIRDVLFTNRADVGFWKDLKDKYAASEIVVDAKNTDDLTRDDLRQLYCYLKPALGFWGFIICRSAPSEAINAFNRTLFKNFRQERGVLILHDDDLRRMVNMALRDKQPSAYLRDRMAEFIRSI